jgi:2-oxo-4-hydroxy-4-carboxy-5-ureidoimidazoline decarboxylase
MNPAPSQCSRVDFIHRFGGVYEHSPWIAEQLFDEGLTATIDAPGPLIDALAEVVARAGREPQLALLRAHPDLAGKLAVSGDLTEASSSEQAGAGLDRCSPEEFRAFQELNDAYQKKFGFPFIVAVRGLNRQEILERFRARVQNEWDIEFDEALVQVHRIARLRIEHIFSSDQVAI